MTPLAWLVAGFLTLQAVVLVWNLYYWKSRVLVTAAPGVTLSVLIPARNEAHNLPRLLEALARQSYPALEIIVGDDASDDGTAEWLAEQGAQFGARRLAVADRPEGWIGKTWACHELAREARGDWLLFLDADIVPEPQFLHHLAAAMTSTPAQMVTSFPRLRPSGVVDALLEIMVGFGVFTLLPLQWSERAGRPRTAFANGQVIGFRHSEYARLQPHREVRGSIVDDVDLARQTKRRGRMVLILDGTADFEVRMYRTGQEALDGFSKNAASACGGPWGALFTFCLLAAVWLAPLVFAAVGQMWAYAAVGMTALLFGLTAALGGLSPAYGLLYPLGVVLGEYVLLRSAVWHWRGEVRWKGRSYRLGRR